jgi:DNA modification methylase
MKIHTLKPHPKHQRIYSNPKEIHIEWKQLYESMKRDGQMQPLLVTGDGTIISGMRRFLVAKELGWEEIEVKVFEGDNREIELLLVSSNSNREKTYAEKINEVVHLLEVIGNRQGKRNLPEHLKGCKYELVSKKYGAGFSKDNVIKIAKIYEHDKKSNTQEKKLDLLKQGVSVDPIYRSLNSRENENDIEKQMEGIRNCKLINKDCNEALIKDIEDGSISLIFTSPPYYSLRRYDGEKKEGNLGEEKSVEEYVKNLAQTFEKVHKKLKDDGSLFVNIGDTFRNGLNLAVPELLLVELSKIGFRIVNRYIWRKTNSKPTTTTSGIQSDYEIVYHFSKQEKYKVRKIVFKSEEAEKVISGCGDRSKDGKKIKKSKSIQSPYRRFKTFYDENEKFSRIITSAAASSQVLHKIDDSLDHPAIFPETLPLLAILQTTDIGDKIMDIFSGSATLGYTANLFGREYIGIEKNKAFHYVGVKRMIDAQSKIDENVYRQWKSEETLTAESSVGKLVEFNNQEEILKMAS